MEHSLLFINLTLQLIHVQMYELAEDASERTAKNKFDWAVCWLVGLKFYPKHLISIQRDSVSCAHK